VSCSRIAGKRRFEAMVKNVLSGNDPGEALLDYCGDTEAASTGKNLPGTALPGVIHFRVACFGPLRHQVSCFWISGSHRA